MKTRRSVVRVIEPVVSIAARAAFPWKCKMVSKLVLTGVLVVCLFTSTPVRADVVVNFDSLPAAGLSGGLSGSLVTNYLASYGITLSGVTPGSAVTVYDTRAIFAGQVIVPSSPYNVIAETGSPDPVSYTLNFAVPQDHFSMTRTAIHPGSTGDAYPVWSASAFNASGTLLETFGEPAQSYYSDLAAKVYTFNGPGITSVRISSDNAHFAAFGSVILDDFTLATAAVPEPSILVLAGLGCVTLLGRQAIRRRRGCY